MSLKPSIFHHVPAKDVSKRVASEFKDSIDVKHLANGVFTVISFPSMRGASTSIIDSKTLIKALKKIEDRDDITERIVVVAHDFTQETLTILVELDAIAFAKQNYFWTDERLRIIVQR